MNDHSYLANPPRLCFRADPNAADQPEFEVLLQQLVASAVPDESGLYELPERTDISNQLTLGSCAANAGADVWELIMPNPVVQVSRLGLYWLARNYHAQTDVDAGTYIRYVFDAVSRYGLCPESEWPYDPSKVFYQPPIDAFVVGSANLIHSYYEIRAKDEDRLDQMDAALYSDCPIVFGTGVNEDFISFFHAPYAHTVIWTPPSRIKGYHAMVVVGRRVRNGRRQYKIRNSWGRTFGVAGYTWFDQSYMTWAETTELWVPSTMPKLIT